MVGGDIYSDRDRQDDNDYDDDNDDAIIRVYGSICAVEHQLRKNN